MAQSNLVALPLALVATVLFAGCAFVSSPGGSAERLASLRGGETLPSGAAAIYGLGLATAPDAAEALTQTQWLKFGSYFIWFWLAFFIAGLVRLFYVGKL